MPDVWDQFPDHPAVAQAKSPDPWDQFPDHPDSEAAMNAMVQRGEARLAAQNPPNLANLPAQLATPTRPAPRPQSQASQAPQGALGNLFNSAISGAVEPLSNLLIRGLGEAGIVTPERAQEAINVHPLPSDPNRISGIIGGGLGQVAQAMTGPAALPIMTASAGENAIENVTNEAAQGRNVSNAGAIADVAGQAAIAAVMAKLAPGQKANAAIIKSLAPQFKNAALDSIKNTLISSGVHIGEAELQNLASNAVTKYTGVNPEQDLTAGSKEAAIQGGLMGGVGQAIHEVTKSPAPKTEQTPKIPEQIPNKTEQPVRVEQLSHPAELPDAKAVADWYGKTFNASPESAAPIEALASMHPGKFKLVDVPVDKIDPNTILEGDKNQAKIDAIKAMSPEDRAKLPPLIAVGDGEKLMIADGTHRLNAAREAGDKTVKAYVPEEFANKPEMLKRFIAGEPNPQAIEENRANQAVVDKLKAAQPPTEPTDSTAVQTKYRPGAEELLTPIIRQMEDINKPAAGRVFEAEFEARKLGAERQAEFDPYAKQLQNYFGKNPDPRTNKAYYEVMKAVHEGDIDRAKSYLPEELHPALDKAVEMSQEILNDRKAEGIKTPELENHVHMQIRDYKAMNKAFGKEIPGPIKEAWDAEMARTNKPLTEERKVEIANDVLNGIGPQVPGRTKPGFEKSRGAVNMTPEMAAHYKPFWQSQHEYIARATEDTERTKLMGQDFTDPNSSIGSIITDEINAGHMNGEDAAKFKDLLQTHLMTKGMAGGWRTAKDIVHLGTLTQVGTALKNIADVGLTAYKYGLKNTAKAAKLVFTKNDHAIMARELGLDDQGHDFRDVGKLGQAVNKALKWSGMLKLDIFTKDVRLNAANEKFKQQVSTPEGEAAFAKEHQDFLGSGYAQTVAALKAGEKNWFTQKLAAHELSKTQPLYKLNMTPAQSKSTGLGRLMYALKPYMLHQLDFMRRDIGRDLVTPGTRAQGLKKLAHFTAMSVAAGMGVNAANNLLNNKHPDLSEQVADGFLGLLNLSTQGFKSAKSDPGAFVQKLLGAPTPFLNDVVKDVSGPWKSKSQRVFQNGKWTKSTQRSFSGLHLIRALPVIGQIAYNWTPLGAGYYTEADQAKKEYRATLETLKNQAEDAHASGDQETAQVLLEQYNQAAKGDPDKKLKPISLRNLVKAEQSSIVHQKKQASKRP